MNAISFPTYKPISGPNEYPYSRNKVQIRGKWYIGAAGGDMIIMCPVDIGSPDPQSMDCTGYICTCCQKIFPSTSTDDLIHECMGVEQ